MNSARKRQDPNWLRPQWEKKKSETAHRIAGAVEMLQREQREITLMSIREAIGSIYNRSISLATIRQSEIYRQNRTNKLTIAHRSTVLGQFYREALPQERQGLQAKASRLRRETKDTLISKLIVLQQTVTKQREVENTLQQEIIRLNQEMLKRGKK